MARIDTMSELLAIMENTLLEGSKVIELEIPESVSRAFAIEIDPGNGFAAWTLMRSYLNRTQRYPVIVFESEYPTSSDDWETSIHNSNLFCRSGYEFEITEDENNGDATDPKSVIAKSQSFNIDKYIEDDEADFLGALGDEEREEFLEIRIDRIQEQFGEAPTLEQLKEVLTGDGIHQDIESERWLLQWELEHFDGAEDMNLEDLTEQYDWFRGGNEHVALILLPTQNSWETPAYLYPHYSGCAGGSGTIAFLKKWHDNYQAELVCHDLTSIDLIVQNVPRDHQEAFELAVEHYMFSDAEIIRSGSLRDYARGLLQRCPWHFCQK
jgi:hypothetical protein